MPKFGVVPTEVPVNRSLDVLAPKFREALAATLQALEGGPVEWPFETLRTEARQAFIHGFGRLYDDGRGVVTNASSALYSFHGFGLAADVVEKDNTPWSVPVGFWEALGTAAEANGLKWGGRWRKPDLPHLYFGKCPATPNDHDRALYASGGVEAVWRKYHAL